MIRLNARTSAYNPFWPVLVSSEQVRRRLYRTRPVQLIREYCRTRLPSIEQPIFMVGTVRSGTTVLARLLGKHPNVMFVGYELTSEWCDFAQIEIARSGNGMAHCPPYTDSFVTEICRKRVHDGFAEIFGRCGGQTKIRFMNKNPHLWNKLPFLKAIFPDARLIITSRDIRSTVASMKLLWIELHLRYRKTYYFPDNLDYCWSVIPPACPPAASDGRTFPGGNVAVLAEHWLHAYETLEKSLGDFRCPTVVKHREFVADPHGMLVKIFERVGVPTVLYSFPERLDTTRNDRWREILTAQEKDELERFIDRNHTRIRRLQCADTVI